MPTSTSGRIVNTNRREFVKIDVSQPLAPPSELLHSKLFAIRNFERLILVTARQINLIKVPNSPCDYTWSGSFLQVCVFGSRPDLSIFISYYLLKARLHSNKLHQRMRPVSCS